MKYTCLLIPVLIVSLFMGCSTLGNGKIDLPEVGFDFEDPQTVYKAGRLMGVAVGAIDKKNNTSTEIASLADRVLLTDPDYFADVLLEEIIIFVKKNYEINSTEYILISEAAAALGFTELDTALLGGYQGDINLEAVKIFAMGVKDGINTANGNFTPYPKFKTEA